MQLAYGTYLFDANAAGVGTSLDTTINEGGQPYEQVAQLRVTGWLSGSTQTALTIATTALRAALATPYQNLILYQDDGAISASSLLNRGSTTGVIITNGPNFPRVDGPDYVNVRYFEFTAQATYPISGTQLLLLHFSEQLRFSGGKAIIAFKKAVNGPPQKQQIYPQDSYRVRQTGEAVGYAAYPQAPPPLFPSALVRSPDFDAISPKRRGLGYTDFVTKWDYHFESATPLSGLPNLWR